MLLPELSPANGVLTPGGAGFLVKDWSSGRDLESSMLRFRNGPEADETKTPSEKPGRAPAATSQCTQYIRLSGWTDRLASHFSVYPQPSVETPIGLGSSRSRRRDRRFYTGMSVRAPGR